MDFEQFLKFIHIASATHRYSSARGDSLASSSFTSRQQSFDSGSFISHATSSARLHAGDAVHPSDLIAGAPTRSNPRLSDSAAMRRTPHAPTVHQSWSSESSSGVLLPFDELLVVYFNTKGSGL